MLNDIDRIKENKKVKFNEGTRAASLRIMLYKMLNDQEWQTDLSKPSYLLSEIQAGVKKRFDLPVFSQPSKKGVYKNFTEFRNNDPSITDFNIAYHKGKSMMLEDGQGKAIPTENIWGFCDGEKRYFYMRKELIELIPCDKSFRVLSFRTKADIKGTINGNNSTSPFREKVPEGMKLREYFDLNMDTGTIYFEEMFGRSTLGEFQKEILR